MKIKLSLMLPLGIMVCFIITGCFCTTTSEDYSVRDVKPSDELRYMKVDSIDSQTEYVVDCIPVEIHASVSESKRVYAASQNSLHGFAWFFTLGIIPAWNTSQSGCHVTVNTPVGKYEGDYTKTEREYLGWVPYMLPFASTESESDPVGELTRRMVAQQKSEWTDAKVAELNAQEHDRIAKKRAEAETLLAIKDWQGIRELCAGEKDKRFCEEYNGKSLDCRFSVKCEKADGLLSEGKWEEVLKLCADRFIVETIEDKIPATNKVVTLKGRILDKDNWIGRQVLVGFSSDTVRTLIDDGKLSCIKGTVLKLDNNQATTLIVDQVCDLNHDALSVYCSSAYSLDAFNKNMPVSGVVGYAIEERILKTVIYDDRDVRFDEEYRSKAEDCRIALKREKAEALLAESKWAKAADMCREEKNDSLVEIYNAAIQQLNPIVQKLYSECDWNGILAIYDGAEGLNTNLIYDVSEQIQLERAVRDDSASIAYIEKNAPRLLNKQIIAEIALARMNTSLLMHVDDEGTVCRLFAKMLKNGASPDENVFLQIRDINGLDGLSDDEILAFANFAVEQQNRRRWDMALSSDKANELKMSIPIGLAINCTKKMSNIKSNLALVDAILSKLAEIKSESKDLWGGDSWDKEDQQLFDWLVSEIECLDEQEFQSAYLAQNLKNWDFIMNRVSPELSAKLLLEGVITNRQLELALVKKSAPDMITVDLYKMLRSESAKSALFDRAPKSIQQEIRAMLDEEIDSLVAKAYLHSGETMTIKGFYLGMPISDALLLARATMQELEFSMAGNGLSINMKGTGMLFCIADEEGNVTRFNFCKKLLKKWFKYDVQTEQEWIQCFADEYCCDFRSKCVSECESNGDASISVVQWYYTYKNNSKGYRVSYFIEPDITDYNKDPETLRGYGRASKDFMMLLSYGMKAKEIETVRNWLKTKFVNGNGADADTLRLELLKE